jgi:hypothetical protein
MTTPKRAVIFASVVILVAIELNILFPASDGWGCIGLLMAKHGGVEKNRPKLIESFRMQRADGGDLAVHFHQPVVASSETPSAKMRRAFTIRSATTRSEAEAIAEDCRQC